MQIRNYLTLGLMLFSTTSFATGSVQMFATKSECLRQFTISSGTSNVIAGENYCKDKVVKSAAEVCADKKLLDFKMKNSISSVQEAQYFQKFKLDCMSASTAAGAGQQANQTTQTAERDAQVAQQKAAMDSQQQQAAAAQAAAAAAKAQGATAQQQQAAAANALQTMAPVIDKAAGDIDKANAAAKKTSAGAAPAAAAPAAVATAAVPAAAASITGPAPTNTSADDGQVFLDKSGNTYERQTVDGEPVITKIDTAGNKSDEINEIPSEAVRVDASAPQGSLDAASVVGPMPQMAGTVADAEKAAQVPSDADGGQGLITSASEAKTAEVKSEVTATIEQIRPTLIMKVPTSMQPFPATVSGLDAFKGKYETFASSLKPTCTKLAETSSFLCVESPGAQAVRTMMDVAGPVLAAVGTIQKACSNTANVTGMASKLLTIAKATCVTAKLACDAGCASANASVKALTAQLKTLNATIASDQTKAMAMCQSESTICNLGAAACLSGCQTNVNITAQQAKAAVAKLTATINKESVPAPAGSVAATQAKCTMNARDIAGLAINALSLMKAKNDAAECDKKLASSGAAGGSVTPTKYCEAPANSGTQFCKCQQNANQEGCPGFAGKGSLIDKEGNKDSVAGINLKTGKGLSSFAGGSRGSGAGGFGANGKQEYNSSAPGTGEKLALSGGDPAGVGSGGAYGGGGAGGGGSSAGGGAGEGAGGKPVEKKWSFGSFANALGGMFGGGSGGKGSNSKGNGNMNSKQEAAIKRKLASDKLAGEITSASGKSNWEKVHQVYKIKDSTLITGN